MIHALQVNGYGAVILSCQISRTCGIWPNHLLRVFLVMVVGAFLEKPLIRGYSIHNVDDPNQGVGD